MAGLGQLGTVAPPGMSARFGIGQETFAGMFSYGRPAPIAAVRPCVIRPASRSLALSTGNSVLGFRLDRSSGVAQIAPRLFAYGAADFLGKSDQRLTGR